MKPQRWCVEVRPLKYEYDKHGGYAYYVRRQLLSLTMRHRLLSVSYDPVLLQTRHLLLSRAGYDVTSVVGFAEAIGRSDYHFDLVVMGHSIPQQDKREIIRALRSRGCNAPVLALIRHNEPPLPEAAASIDTDPERLMESTASLLAQH